MMNTNPYVWDPSAKNVTTGTLTLQIDPCDGQVNKRKKRAAGSVGMSIGLAGPKGKGNLTSYNTTDVFGMLTHVFNLTAPGVKPITLQVTYEAASYNNTLIVYIRRDKRPTPAEYDVILTPSNFSAPDNSTGNVTTYTYSYYFKSNDTFGVKFLHVGVQTVQGIKMHSIFGNLHTYLHNKLSTCIIIAPIFFLPRFVA